MEAKFTSVRCLGVWLIAQVHNWIIAVWMFWVGARERIRANRNVLEELM